MAVARGADILVDVGDAGVERGGVGGGGFQGGLDGAEEDVGVGAGDAVEVLVFCLTGRRAGVRGVCVSGVNVASNHGLA